MKRIFKIFILLLCLSLVLPGCGNAADQPDSPETGNTANDVQTSNTETVSETEETAFAILPSEMFTDRDKEVGYDEDNCVKVQLQNEDSLCNSDNVQIDNQIITISEEGTYLITGTLTNGMLWIDAADTDKIHLVLDDASISNSTSAAIYIKEADKVFITLAPDSENTLANGGTYTAIDDNNIDAVIFSKSDLTLNGSGSLTILAEAGHGIVSKDDLVITGGNYIISSASHGLSGKDSIRIASGNFTITSGKDALQTENEDDDSLGFLYIANGSFIITADDGISSSNYIQIDNGDFEIAAVDDGIHTNADLIINGGTINISQCYEGLEGLTVQITDGQIHITSDDDGINAAGSSNIGSDMSGGMMGQKGGFGADSDASIDISGGTVYVSAEGDGIDSNGSLSISGGTVYVSGPTKSGNASLDFGSEAIITGGLFAAFGPSQMAQNFSTNSPQGSIMISVAPQTAGSSVSLKNDSGKEIFSFQPEKAYDCIIISSSEIIQGETYTITAGTSDISFTMDNLIYSSGGDMNGFPGDMNGFPGGMKNHTKKPDDRGEKPSSQPGTTESDLPMEDNIENNNSL